MSRQTRVADRMYKKCPLFAVEFMQKEFYGYTENDFILDVTRKRSNYKKNRKIKSQKKIQGRYWLMQNSLAQYQVTKDIRHLVEAQRLRNNLFKKFIIEYKLGKGRLEMFFPSTTSYSLIQELVKVKFSSFEELNTILDDKLKYGSAG